jgi:ketosteroid isomerase-like protein
MTGSSFGGVDFGKLFVSIDSMDMEGFLGFIAADAEFRFGSAPPVQGRAGIRSAVEGFFSSIAAVRHDLKRIVAQDDTVVCEGEVTYTRHDGSSITLPFCNVFETDAGLISVYRIYVDIAPLYAA